VRPQTRGRTYQVCGHLLHIEECDWLDRTRVILEHGTTRVFEPVDQGGPASRASPAGHWPTLLDRFAATRRANLEELTTLLGAGDLGRRGIHPRLRSGHPRPAAGDLGGA